jgi:hypothetical protein
LLVLQRNRLSLLIFASANPLAFEGILERFLLGRVCSWDNCFRAVWGAVMNRNDQYLARAADCQLMACMTRDEHERQTWLDMAHTWLRLVELPERTSSLLFDKNNLLSWADRNHFGNAA